MILHWMRYTVSPARRARFTRAQNSWRVLIEAAGFIARFGGWREGTAEIAALWQNEATYKRFMDYLHDPIERSSHQVEAYASIERQLARSFLVIPDDLEAFTEVLNTARHFLVTPAPIPGPSPEAKEHTSGEGGKAPPEIPDPILTLRARRLDDPHQPLNLYLWPVPAPGAITLEPTWTVLVPRA